jgi:hypothetical protein
MAERKLPEVFKFSDGEVAVWYDDCVCIKAVTRAPHYDPVELTEDEAVELAETLLRLAKENR